MNISWHRTIMMLAHRILRSQKDEHTAHAGVACPTALAQALASARYEIMPMGDAIKQTQQLSADVPITLTCSPTRGIEKTVALAESICALGYTTVPHLAAWQISSKEHLRRIVSRLEDVGINEVFVVGGDNAPAERTRRGPFASGVELVDAIAQLNSGIGRVGVPCYPEGHPFIDDQSLDRALIEKSRSADYLVTQICFDVQAIRKQLQHIRALGVTLPVYIGIPGVIKRRKLLSIALRIGLGDSTRFLKKQVRMIGQLASTSTYTPNRLVESLAATLNDPELDIAGFHLNSFNQIEKTEVWRQNYLAKAKS